MAQGKRINEWYYWSSLEALLANCHRDPKKGRPYRAEDFHPFLCHMSRDRSGVQIGDLVAAAAAMDRRRRLRLVG